jgi:hypothetical protein
MKDLIVFLKTFNPSKQINSILLSEIYCRRRQINKIKFKNKEK